MTDVLTTLAALAAAGAAYFLGNWLVLRRRLAAMTTIEKAQERIAADRAHDDKVPRRERIRLWMAAHGYRGDLTIPLVALGFLYLVAGVALRVAGMSSTVAGLGAMPIAALLGYGLLTRHAGKRRAQFNAQLIQALEMLAGQMEAGYGTQRALDMVAPNLADPLRSEFRAALDASQADNDLVGAFERLGERYPSRAFDMFLAALRIDRERGGRLAPALRKAAAIAERQQALISEARSELAQSKQTVVGVGVIVGGAVVFILTRGHAVLWDAYLSPVGLIALPILTVNYLWGMWRCWSMLGDPVKE